MATTQWSKVAILHYDDLRMNNGAAVVRFVASFHMLHNSVALPV